MEMEQPKVTGKRFETGFHILNQWLCLRQRGGRLFPYFEENLVGRAAIYGMGALGERLYEELQGGGVSVVYAVDRAAGKKHIPGLKIYGLEEEELPDADVMIVTPVQDYWPVVAMMETKTKAAIVSLEDIIEYCAPEGDR